MRVLIIAALALGGLGACGGDEPVDAGAPAAPASTAPVPKDLLVKAVQQLDTASYNFVIKQASSSGTGRVDAKAKAATVQLSGKVDGTSISLEYVIIAPDVWLKADFGTAANKQLGINKTKYMHIDASKVEDKTSLPIDAEGNLNMGTATMLQGAAEVKQTDATHFTGVADLTGADSLVSPDADLLKKVGDKAKAVPFTATIDDKGRLTALKLDGSTIDPGLSADVAFTGFDAVKPITKPSGAINAPASVYKIFTTS